MKRFLARGGVIFAALAVMALLIAPLRAPVSFCSVCGAQAEMQGLVFRSNGRAFCRFQKAGPTDFSAVLEAKRLVPVHAHIWQAPQMVSDPMDAFGPPVLESLAFLNAPRVVNFTRDVADFADPRSAARWRELVLQPHYARLLDGTLRFLRVPADGFGERTAFLTWWGQNSYAVYNRLRELSEPD